VLVLEGSCGVCYSEVEYEDGVCNKQEPCGVLQGFGFDFFAYVPNDCKQQRYDCEFEYGEKRCMDDMCHDGVKFFVASFKCVKREDVVGCIEQADGGEPFK